MQSHRAALQLAVPTGLDAYRAAAAAERNNKPGEQDQEGEDGEGDRKFHEGQGACPAAFAKPKPPPPPNKKPAGRRVGGRARRQVGD
jgi:hypothetical protein